MTSRLVVGCDRCDTAGHRPSAEFGSVGLFWSLRFLFIYFSIFFIFIYPILLQLGGKVLLNSVYI